MNPSLLQDPAWYRATTLAERIASRSVDIRVGRTERHEAERRLARWRSQPPFTNASLFAERLRLDGLAEDAFLDLLGEPPEALRARSAGLPPWLGELCEALCHGAASGVTPFAQGAGDELSGLLRWAEPLVEFGLARLRQRLHQVVGARARAPVDLGTIERILVADLPGQVCAMIGRTLVLELNVARVEGLLQGRTPEERFRSFVRRLRRPEIALPMLREYPVLARQLMIRLNQWVACSLEFLERLGADWDLIRATLSPDEDPGVLLQLQTDAGDRHRNGRSVAIAKFTSGFQLVYKPKSMAVDAHFQELLAWINQRAGEPAFRIVRILNRDTYGWAEFVAAHSCDSLPALRRFYERQGAYLALLYALHGIDLHCDNVIAAGEHPVLIDLEALFQPHCLTPQAARQGADTMALEHSVLRVGLLPERVWSSPESDGVDLTGLGGTPGQITPYGVPEWEQAGTDHMHLTRRRVAMPGASNRPSLNGHDVHLVDYIAEIAAGFTRTYRVMMEHRDALLSPGGPLARFADDEVRVIVRPTRTYAVLLNESFHPDVLRDALDRDLLFDQLWVAVEPLPYLAKVVQAEREDLEQGDIPIFTTRPHSRDLRTSSGRRVADFLDEPPLALVQRRLRALSERDLALQGWLIRAALAATAPEDATGIHSVASKSNGSQGLADHDQLLSAARTVGDRLEFTAIRADQAASWVGLMLEPDGHWAVAPLTLDLYDGLAGVTLFLAHLGAVTGARRYTELAQQALPTVRRRAEEAKSSLTSIGAFSGWGGVVYLLAHLGVLWHEPDLLREADAVVARIRGLIERDEQFDIVAGAAGCIGALIALLDAFPSQGALSAAMECGEHLIRKMQRTERGVGWTATDQRLPLSGFAHGAAGIAWALLKLAALTGEERFRTIAIGAIAHERSLFSPQARNWRDLRLGGANGESFMTAWCNGAPGIGLARLSTLPQLDDPDVRSEIDAALHTTLDHGFGQSHSLCHGDLGNLELLLHAGRILEDRRWHAEAYRLAKPAVESVSRKEYHCGTPLGLDSPGLMTGLAGIGYQLLRLVEPARVPSVLTLEPPLRDRVRRYENL